MWVKFHSGFYGLGFTRKNPYYYDYLCKYVSQFSRETDQDYGRSEDDVLLYMTILLYDKYTIESSFQYSVFPSLSVHIVLKLCYSVLFAQENPILDSIIGRKNTLSHSNLSNLSFFLFFLFLLFCCCCCMFSFFFIHKIFVKDLTSSVYRIFSFHTSISLFFHLY